MTTDKIISIQPAAFTDNVWVGKTGEIVEGKKMPYPFHIDAATGDVQNQDFWQGDPFRVVGFQADVDRQQVDLWWREAAQFPEAIIGMYPVIHRQGIDMTVLGSLMILLLLLFISAPMLIVIWKWTR